MRKKILVVLGTLFVTFVLSSCGSYESDLDKICNVVEMSGSGKGNSPQVQEVRFKWLDENVNSSDGKELLAALAYADPDSRAEIIRQEAAKNGITICPLFDGNGKSKFMRYETASLRLPTSNSQVIPDKAVTLLVQKESVIIDDMKVLMLVGGLVKAEDKQNVGRGYFVVPVYEKLKEDIDFARALLAKNPAANTQPNKVVIVADQATDLGLLKELIYSATQAGFENISFAVSKHGTNGEHAIISVSTRAIAAGPSLIISSTGFSFTGPGQTTPIQIPIANGQYNYAALAATMRQSWGGAQLQLTITGQAGVPYAALITTLDYARADVAGWLYPNICWR